MRVLYSFPHALGAPGIGWTAWNQVDGLVRAGHEVHAVAASVRRPIHGAASVTTSLAAGRLRLPHRAIGRDRALAWHDLVARSVLARHEVDIVHLWPLTPGRTARAARDAGIAVVREAPNTHTRRAWAAVAAESARIGLTGGDRTAHTEDPAHLAMEQAEWDAANAVLAPSDAVAASFAAEGFAPDRIVRHRYGYRPGDRRVRPRTARPQPLRAVFVGLGEPRKGLHHALRAWIDSDASIDGTLTVVGRMLPAYERLLAADLAHPSVVVVGFSADVEAALAASDVLVLPTVEEGSALVTYEAQGVGCVPLVSTAAGAVLEHGVTGLLHDPGDVATLRSHLDALAADRAVLARMSAAGIARSPQLTWDAAAQALEDAYATTLDAAKGGAGALVG
jgi:glycosyltransferase involved in cell wall biosynthesis